MAQVIVVGGGLSGLSAAHTVLEHGGNVVLIDKMGFFGGNSTKATSGINGALTRTQISKGIQDSAEKFYQDTAHSARGLLRAPLAKVLTYNSASAIEWLQDKFNLDLSLVSRLGGHSYPRTHRGGEKFPGMTITYALMEKFEELTKSHPGRVRQILKATVSKLLKDDAGNIVGVEYEKGGQLHQEHGPVVLATGGYAADFTNTSLLQKHRPDLVHLPTTNGDWSTGDGLKLSEAVGANLIDMKWVQVHPTGLVDPAEPEAKVKFLAAEALRGVGGILLDAGGDRFCNELGHRDYVTGEMWKRKKGPYRLILNSAAGKEIEWHCKHYSGRGLMKKFNSGDALAKEMGISTSKLQDTFNKYTEVSKNPSTDPFGKKFFDNATFNIKDEYWVAIVTPVLHFCMGGLEIDDHSHVLGANKAPISGLFAAGEVAGGVHGENRLGGSSLLGCVVYGRVAGASASRFLFEQLSAGGASASSGSSGPFSTKIEIDPKTHKVNIDLSFNGVSTTRRASSSAAAAAPAEVEAPKARGALKEYTYDDVAKHNKETDCWVVVNGQVLDVTSFLKDHPGGKKAILIYAGRDATEEFNMLHKPDVVEKYAPDSIIGKLAAGSVKPSHTSGHELRAKL